MSEDNFEETILTALKEIAYPGFSKDIISLGAVLGVTKNESGDIQVLLKTISADEPVLEELTEKIKAAVGPHAEGGQVIVSFGEAGASAPQGDPHQHQHGDESVFQRNRLPGVGQVIPVVSGKGGVGKSTTTVNLAYTLKSMGHKVGILDLDLFGPSIHKMLGADGAKLSVINDMIAPFEKNGLKIISIGMALDGDEALVLRGPMVMKLLNQLLSQVHWGELDYLVVDMPPGTGDIPLSLVQQLHVTGAVVVTTPQDISLIDVRRAVSMFEKTETSVLGVIENMSYYKCESCGDIAHIFGHGGGKEEAARLKLPLLGQIPLVKSICEEADAGNPIFDRDKNQELAKTYEEIANNVIEAANKAEEEHEEKAKTAQEPGFQSALSGGGSCSV